MTLPTIDINYFTKFLVDLLNIASPTGFAEPAIAFVEKELSQFKQLELSRTRKGALIAKWKVDNDLPPVALTASDCIRAGAADFLKKPFSISQIRESVAKAMAS